MLRRLLACLALITGLAAAGAPAQAEVVVTLASRMEVSAPDADAACGQAENAIPRPGFLRVADLASVARPLAEPPASRSAVRLRSDRARE